MYKDGTEEREGHVVITRQFNTADLWWGLSDIGESLDGHYCNLGTASSK